MQFQNWLAISNCAEQFQNCTNWQIAWNIYMCICIHIIMLTKLWMSTSISGGNLNSVQSVSTCMCHVECYFPGYRNAWSEFYITCTCICVWYYLLQVQLYDMTQLHNSLKIRLAHTCSEQNAVHMYLEIGKVPDT